MGEIIKEHYKVQAQWSTEMWITLPYEYDTPEAAIASAKKHQTRNQAPFRVVRVREEVVMIKERE